jgi:hypothetical protein
VLTAFATWIFALGPDPTFMNHRLLYRAPYSALMMLPGFDGLRVPARFWTMTLACLAVVGALAVHRLQGSARRVVVAIAAAGLLLDGWPRHFVVRDAPPLRPSPPDAVVRLDLPVTDYGDVGALYQQMFDAKPLYNGFSGFSAPHYFAMRELLDAHDPEILRSLASRGPLGIVIDHAGDENGALRAMVRAFPGSTPVQTHADWSSYLIPRTDPIGTAAEPHGSAVRIAGVNASAEASRVRTVIDGDLESSWSAGKQLGNAAFDIELERAARVNQLVIELGQYSGGFPERLQISVSADGASWDTVTAGGTALQTYHAALQHPKEVPLVYAIERDNVRFIRLEQTGRSPREWSIAELRVLQ